MSKLLPIERETIILFNEGEEAATVETCNHALQNRMDGLCAKSADCCLLREDEHCKKYQCPKSWVKVHLPRQYTEEQRRKMRERALKALQRGSEK